MQLLNNIIAALVLAATDRNRLAMENLALRQQLLVLKRGKKRATLEDSDRVFWILLSRMIKDWAEHLVIVQPETVIRWHRKGFAYYWKRKTRTKPGRPSISMKVIHMIRRMSKENPLSLPETQNAVAATAYAIRISPYSLAINESKLEICSRVVFEI